MIWLTKIKGYLIIAGAAILGIIAIFLRGRSQGRDEVKTEVMIAKQQAMEQAHAVENKVNAMPNATVRDRLRKFQRD